MFMRKTRQEHSYECGKTGLFMKASRLETLDHR